MLSSSRNTSTIGDISSQEFNSFRKNPQKLGKMSVHGQTQTRTDQ